MWLGSDELEEGEVSTSSSLSRGRLSAGFPTYNLQRVDITVRYYRTGTDDGVTFRTAAFDAVFYWLVPEPTTLTPILFAAAVLVLRHRRMRVRSGVGRVSQLRFKKAWIVVLLVVACFERPAAAEMIAVPFSGVVTEVVGDPFGIEAQVGVTTVSGSFVYDPAAESNQIGANFARFPARIRRGFEINVQGVMISSSEYVLSTNNNVLIPGGSDLFRAGAPVLTKETSKSIKYQPEDRPRSILRIRTNYCSPQTPTR